MSTRFSPVNPSQVNLILNLSRKNLKGTRYSCSLTLPTFNQEEGKEEVGKGMRKRS